LKNEVKNSEGGGYSTDKLGASYKLRKDKLWGVGSSENENIQVSGEA